MSQATASVAQGGDGSIQVSGLRHVYKKGVVALDGVDLEIGTGLFGLLGPNGAGKSTLMKILCTLIVPTEGQVTVNGFDALAKPRDVRQSLGYLPQDFGAWRLQRVREALDSFAMMAGISSRAERKDRVTKALEQVNLLKVADRKVKKLSGGMRRRLGVAQALVHDPKIIVVDEPTVGLDPEERNRFSSLMAELALSRTIVLSTHIIADLGAACQNLAIIDSGRIEFRGSPTELVQAASDKVFELIIEPGSDLSGEGYEVVAHTRDEEGRHKLRAVATTASPPAGAVRAETPSLEEAYLAFMASRGRADAAVSGAGLEEERG